MTELEMLKAENSQLKRDQEFMFLVIELAMATVEKWAKDNDLLLREDTDQNLPNGNNQVRVFVEQIRKLDQDTLFDRLVCLLDRLKECKELV